MKFYFGLVLLLTVSVSGAEGVGTKTEKPEKIEKAEKAKATKTESSREHNFEDLLVQGKYHFSDEAVTTVEEDKVLDSLLGVRSDFKDRIEKSTGRY